MKNNKFFNFLKRNNQKIIYLSLFALIILSFIYAICYMSNMWILSTTGYKVIGSYGSDRTIVYEQINLVNNLIFIFAIILIIVLALAFLFGNKTRIKYYVSNYVFGYTLGTLAIIFSIIVMVNTGKAKTKLLYASYGEFTYINGQTAADAENNKIGNSLNVIYPEGIKEKYGCDSPSSVTYVTPKSVDTPNFTIEGCNTTMNLAYVLYTCTIISGGAIIALTTYKLINSKKKEEN